MSDPLPDPDVDNRTFDPPVEPEEMHEHTVTRALVPTTGPGLRNGRADLHGPARLPDIQRLLPQAPDAEKGLLCSFLLAPQAIGDLCAEKGITPAHFQLPHHALIYHRLQLLHGRGEPIDFITLTQLLRDEGKLDECGGAAYITELFTLLPTAANAGQYIEILIEKWVLRESIRIGTDLTTCAYEAQDGVWELVERGQRNLLAVAELANGRRSRLPGLRDISTMLGVNKPPCPPVLIAGLLHKGSKLIIGGTSKGRKTFSLIDMAISVATGTTWWGMETMRGRVCYINFEIQEHFFCSRVEDICRVKNVSLEPGRLMGWTLRGHTEGIECMVVELLAVLLRENFDLIIFDPIYKALGNRDENKAGDVASLCNELERIAVRTGAAIAFGAHYSKGNQSAKEAIDRIGGSGVFARDPDAILTMTAHEVEECFTVECTLRNFPPLAPFVVKWGWPLFALEDGADPLLLKQANTGQFTTKWGDQDVLKQMSVLDGYTKADLRRRCWDERGMPKTTFYRFMDELEAEAKTSKARIICKMVPGRRCEEYQWFLKPGVAK